MKSQSKYEVSRDSIVRMFEKAGIKNVKNIAPLGAGEFNSVYSADSDGKSYAVKIAPYDTSKTLTYEKDMMAQEIYYYSLMESVGIKVPKIYAYDSSKTIIETDYFIMERLKGEQLDKVILDKAGKAVAHNQLVSMVAKMHTVKGEKFGYRQNQLHDNWYLAISNMVCNLIIDCKNMGYTSKHGKKLLDYIHKNKDVLQDVKCTLINFDIWPPNIFADENDGKISLAWIDPERCLFGDRIADFVCLEFMNMSLDSKAKSLEVYNRMSHAPIILGNNERIRFGIMLGYLGLIMEVEKYARYTLTHFGYWRNVMVSRMLFKKCFSVINEIMEG